MSIIKESKSLASTKIADAIEALYQYMNELEADETFGPLYDGSTMNGDLVAAHEHLSEAYYYFRTAHERSHWGL